MNTQPTALCIVPARGGSKRLPRKNIRPFRGRPIIEWSISAAAESGLFAKVMVSTDDDEIASVARAAGAEVPFLRSPGASDDHATTSDVLLEVLARYAQLGERFEFACCLYPTAPFVRADDLRSGFGELLSSEFDVVMPIAAFSYPIWRSLKRDDKGAVLLNFPENLNVRSQDLPSAYHDAGQWYWFRTGMFLQQRVLMGQNTGSLLLPPSRVQDIDTEEDWSMAEIKHERIFR